MHDSGCLQDSNQQNLKSIYSYVIYNRMLRFIFNSEAVKKQDRCSECNIIFHSYSRKLYCCEKSSPVCLSCQNKPCLKCKRKRLTSLNVQCSKCFKPTDESQMYYDFQQQKIYCSKCLSHIYFAQYKLRASTKQQEWKNQIALYSGAKYPFQDVQKYYRSFCLSCGQAVNDQNAFEMMNKARACQICLQTVQELINWVLFCEECNGFVRNLQQIYSTITGNRIFCTFCNKLSQQAQERRQNYKQKSIISTQVRKSSLISAADISRLRENNLGNSSQLPSPMSKIVKIVSKNSIEEFQQNVQLQIKVPLTNKQCDQCKICIRDDKLFAFSNDVKNPFLQLKSELLNIDQRRLCGVCFQSIAETFKIAPLQQKYQERVEYKQTNTMFKTGLSKDQQFNERVLQKTVVNPHFKQCSLCFRNSFSFPDRPVKNDCQKCRQLNK